MLSKQCPESPQIACLPGPGLNHLPCDKPFFIWRQILLKTCPWRTLGLVFSIPEIIPIGPQNEREGKHEMSLSLHSFLSVKQRSHTCYDFVMFLFGKRRNLPLEAPNKRGRVTIQWPQCQPPHIVKKQINHTDWSCP